MDRIIRICESGQSRIRPYNRTLLRGILKRYTAASPIIGIRQHKSMMNMYDFFMGMSPGFVEVIDPQGLGQMPARSPNFQTGSNNVFVPSPPERKPCGR